MSPEDSAGRQDANHSLYIRMERLYDEELRVLQVTPQG